LFCGGLACFCGGFACFRGGTVHFRGDFHSFRGDSAANLPFTSIFYKLQKNNEQKSSHFSVLAIE